jgi:hypothetical protein
LQARDSLAVAATASPNRTSLNLQSWACAVARILPRNRAHVASLPTGAESLQICGFGFLLNSTTKSPRDQRCARLSPPGVPVASRERRCVSGRLCPRSLGREFTRLYQRAVSMTDSEIAARRITHPAPLVQHCRGSAGATASGPTPWHAEGRGARRPRAALSDVADHAGRDNRVRDRDSRSGARHLPPVARDAAVPGAAS